MDVLLGALVAGAFAVAGVLYQARREHDQWLRSSRLEAYSSFMAAVTEKRLAEDNVAWEAMKNNIPHYAVRESFTESPEFDRLYRQLIDTGEAALLLASEPMRSLCERLMKFTIVYGMDADDRDDDINKMDDRISAFREGARVELLPRPGRWRRSPKAIAQRSA